MWVWTQSTNSDGHTILIDLTQVGTISLIDPPENAENKVWKIVAGTGHEALMLAEAPTLAEAHTIQRRIFNSLATGEKAINLNAGRRPGTE